MGSYEISADFVARENVLSRIHQVLDPISGDLSTQRVHVVAGLGGTGKTQIALSYASSHQDTYRVVLWADADGQAKLSESFILFARELGLGDLNSLQAKQAVKECLQDIGEMTSDPFCDASLMIDIFQRSTFYSYLTMLMGIIRKN